MTVTKLKSIVKVPADIQGENGITVDQDGRTVIIGLDPNAIPEFTLPFTFADLFYATNTNTVGLIAPNTTATQKVLAMTGTGSIGAVPTWQELSSVTDTSKVLKAGDTMTGNLTIARVSANNSLLLDKSVGSFQNAIWGMRNNEARWNIVLGNTETDADVGANTGSNFEITRYNDSGIAIDKPLEIERSNGMVTIGDLTVTDDLVTNDLTVTGATLTVTPTASVNASILLNKGTGAGLESSLWGTRNGEARWKVTLGDVTTDADAGGSTGSDFVITRYNDSGAAINFPLSIERSTGNMTIPGNVGIGATPGTTPGFGDTNTGLSVLPTGVLAVSRSGTICARFNINADGINTNFQRSGVTVGNITVTTTATAYNTSSDERLKTDLKSFDAGHIVDNTEVYDFKWKETGERAYGVVAQQAKEVYETPTFYDAESDRYYVDYSKYVPILLQELKTLRERVAALEGATAPKPA